MTDGQKYKTGQAASLLGINPRTLREWAKTGLLSYERTVNGCFLYPADEIRALLKQLSSGDPSSPFPRIRKGRSASVMEFFVAIHFGGDASAAMLELAAYCGIAVHYLDRDWFDDFLKRRGHILTEEEWKRIAGQLGDYWAVIDDTCRKQIEGYANQVLQAAAVNQKSEPHPKTGKKDPNRPGLHD